MRLGYWVSGLGFGFAVVALWCGEASKPTVETTPAPPAAQVERGVAPPATPTTNSLADLGIPLYPGANVSSSDLKDKIFSANLTTSDSVDKVAAYYEKQLGVKPKKEGPLTTFDVAKKDMQFAVVVTAAQGSTSIGILGERK